MYCVLGRIVSPLHPKTNKCKATNMKRKFTIIFLCLLCTTRICAQEFGVEYTGELNTNFSSKANFLNLLRLNASLPLGKHLTFNASTLSYVEAKDESVCFDLQLFSNLKAYNIILALSNLNLQWDINERHTLSLGIRCMNEDYFVSPVTSLFTNASCGIFPTISVNFDIANYPLASMGAHYRYQKMFSPDAKSGIIVQGSLYNGQGYYNFAGRDNVFRFCPKDDGLFGLAQIEYQHHDSHYFLGVCGMGDFADYYDSPLSTTLWAYAEQQITDRLTLIAAYSHAFLTDALCSDFAGVGGKYDWRCCEFGLLTDYANFFLGGEFATELTCKVQVNKYLHIQPALHLISSPSLFTSGREFYTAGALRLGLTI